MPCKKLTVYKENLFESITNNTAEVVNRQMNISRSIIHKLDDKLPPIKDNIISLNM